jgi:hypothetical protein
VCSINAKNEEFHGVTVLELQLFFSEAVMTAVTEGAPSEIAIKATSHPWSRNANQAVKYAGIKNSVYSNRR